MSHKHDQFIRTIFQDPISANIHWREVESFLNHLGATVEPIQGARFKVVLNGVEGVLHRPHHSNVCSRQEIKHLREYLASARVTPSLYEAAQERAER
ncbi:MAG: type II toxin-antitoxin system HicA family toxin [Gallionellaceae bacterium]|nr:type II toxin-antitoxin system HicA family toxin [Gallionellaceae bacterium]MDD5364567.1 type II toxin-antitoxin system HicA family toxin [Gallionellaceae bacterium]